MQRLSKIKRLKQFAILITLSTALLAACNSSEKKVEGSDSVEVKTDSITATKDSIPPLVVDPNTTTRPETIKNTTGGN